MVNLRKCDIFLTVIPSKIFEAAAMEKPILLGLEGETKGIIEQYGAERCFEPENAVDFQEKLIQIQKHEHQQACIIGCKKLARDFDRKRIAEELLTTIKAVVNK
jgi:glycosyltransferase involved in cell wall biosynthesis